MFCFQHAERWLTKNMTSSSKVEEEYVHKFMFYFFTSWVLKCFSSQMAVLKENLKGLSPLLWNCEIHTAQDMVPMKNVLFGWFQMSNFTWAKLNARVKCMLSATFESIKLNAMFAVSATETVEDSTKVQLLIQTSHFTSANLMHEFW